VPWERHTTIGTSQMSHSAIQQMSSSWNQGVIRAARHSSQFAAGTYSTGRAVSVG
jgi:hypothetical protein